MEMVQFEQALKDRGFSISPDQAWKYERYYELLVEWNEKINLTAITDREEVYEKHFYDSVAAAFFFDFVYFVFII